jgi:hypothetical protein
MMLSWAHHSADDAPFRSLLMLVWLARLTRVAGRLSDDVLLRLTAWFADDAPFSLLLGLLPMHRLADCSARS